jgi:putative ABC transport system permease protein
MSLFFKFTWREVIRFPRFSFFFILNICIGLTGFMLLETFKDTFNQSLHERSKTILGADLSIGGRLPLSEEKKQLAYDFLQAEQMVFVRNHFAMMAKGEKNLLVYLEQYHPDFPFYGGYKLQKNIQSPGGIELNENEIWIYPETLIHLGAQIGDSITIGKAELVIADVITEDSLQTFQMGALAPKVLIHEKALGKAGLFSSGATGFYTTFFRTNNHQVISEEEKNQLNNLINDSSQNIKTPKDSSEQVGRVIIYLSDFLGLVSLVAFLLSLIGIFYIYRGQIAHRRQSIAILKTLGSTQQEILWGQIIYLGFMSLMGAIAAAGISFLLSFALASLLKNTIPFELSMTPTPLTLLATFIIAIFGVLTISYPLIRSLIKQNPGQLFLDQASAEEDRVKIPWWNFIPFLLFFLALSIWLSQSFINGPIFVGVCLLIIVIFFPVLEFILRRYISQIKSRSLILTLGFRYMGRYRMSTISIFLALLFGSMLLNLIPGLEHGLQQELDGGLNGPAPSLFLFDVQESQIEGLKQFSIDHQTPLLDLSPMVRARLIALNGQPLKIDHEENMTREEEQERRSRNRGINISYGSAQELEQIVKGSPLRHYSGSGPADVSLEERYAKRIGAKLGDLITFDILGIEIEAQVQNIRKVRWTSFRPNFFIVFATGVLEEAPKTYLSAFPYLDQEKKVSTQTELVKMFPNISAVDLDRLVAKLKSVIAQMSYALMMMTSMVVVVGFFVIFAMINHQMRDREMDMNLLKIVGLDLFKIRLTLLIEFLFITFIASLIGSLIGIAFTYLFSYIAFDGVYAFQWQHPVLIVFSFSLFVGLIVSFMTWFHTQKKSMI